MPKHGNFRGSRQRLAGEINTSLGLGPEVAATVITEFAGRRPENKWQALQGIRSGTLRVIVGEVLDGYVPRDELVARLAGLCIQSGMKDDR